MRRLIPTAVLAVFLSLFISGCYTQLKGPEPRTGERTYEGDYYRGDYSPYYYWDDYWYPSFFGFPYYNYGFFYSPWWYDPGFYYYYYGNGNLGTSKALRDRGHDGLQPSPPAGVIIRQPDSPPAPSDGGKARSGDEGRPSSGGNDQQPKKTNSEGKTTRTRR